MWLRIQVAARSHGWPAVISPWTAGKDIAYLIHPYRTARFLAPQPKQVSRHPVLITQSQPPAAAFSRSPNISHRH
jgi:hypothetical protein